MTIMQGFRLDERGRMIIGRFNCETLPEGWFDSPEKADPKPVVEEKRPTLKLKGKRNG